MNDYDSHAFTRPEGVLILRDANHPGDVGLLFDGADEIIALTRNEAVALSDALALAVL